MRVEVFAVEDRRAQIVWRGRPDDGTVVRAGDAAAALDADLEAGAVDLEDLPPATTLDLLVEGPGAGTDRAGVVRTLAPPPGDLLFCLATMNDLHLGARSVDRPRDPPEAPGDPTAQAVVCAAAALDEAQAWGARTVVVKGDVTQWGRAEEWEAAGALLGRAGLPVHAVPGNHDTCPGSVPGDEILARHGVDLTYSVAALDLPGLRVVLANSTVPGRGYGAVARRQHEICDALAAAPGPALLALHHYPQRLPFPVTWPPGIPGGEAWRFLEAVAEANPAAFVTTGHTHRHRHRRHGTVEIGQVGSTKDYPGTWAGYAIHAGGIRQVVRRVAAPAAMAWTERTRRAAFGVWGLVAPGRLGDRCFSVTWPARS